MSVRPNHWRDGWKYRPSEHQRTAKEATIAHFAQNDAAFQSACRDAKVEPTKLQARKFKQKRGKAYRAISQSQAA